MGLPTSLTANRYQEDEPQTPGGTLHLTLPERPGGLDPLTVAEGPLRGLRTLVFGGLYEYHRSTGLVAYLAVDEPTIEDGGRRYVVSIREDAQFHDGNPVLAEDVQYSVETAREERGEESPLATFLESTSVIDDRTVAFDLAEPYAPFLHLLTLDVVPESVRENDPGQFESRPVGAGPFRAAGRQAGHPLRFEQWEEYWNDPQPLLSAVEVTFVDSPTDRIGALRSGDSDVVATIPPDLYPDVEELESASVAERPAMAYVYVGFDCQDGPTADPMVREAIDYSTSLDRAVDDFVAPAGVRQYSPLPPPLAADWEFPVEEWRNIPRERDLEAASERFEAAGVPSDWSPAIAIPDDDVARQLAVAIANGTNEAGYGATIETYDAGDGFGAAPTDSDEYDLFVGRWWGLADPDSFTYPLFSREAEGETNATYYRNDTVEENLTQARRTTDRAERRDAYAEAITILLEERVHLPAFDPLYSFAVRESVEDFQAHPVVAFRVVSGFNNVSVEE